MWRDTPKVYFLRPVQQRGPIKIGWSRLPTDRLRAYQNWSPVLLELIATTPGDEGLEAKLHAQFAHLHLHGEWFRWAHELDATIASIISGTFDPEGLPAGRRLHKKLVPQEAIDAGRMTRRLIDLRNLGVPIPDDVQEASRTYGLNPAEVARRRAVVASFVVQHEHLRDAARAATSKRRTLWVSRSPKAA